MRRYYLSALAAIVVCMSFVGGAPAPGSVPGMPLLLWFTGEVNIGAAPKEHPFTLPLGVVNERKCTGHVWQRRSRLYMSLLRK